MDMGGMPGLGIEVFDRIPEGWKVLDGASAAPKGMVFIYNGKSRFSGGYRHGLVRSGDVQGRDCT